MDIVMTTLSIAVFLLLAFTAVGGPMLMLDWIRARRLAVIARQIALCDALDARFGAIVAPVVTKPYFSPWEVRIRMPFLRPAVLASMLALIDEVFASGEATPSNSYRIVLTVAERLGSQQADQAVHSPVGRLAHTPASAV